MVLKDYPTAVLIGWAEKGLNFEVVERMEGKDEYDWESFDAFKRVAIKSDEHVTRLAWLKQEAKVRNMSDQTGNSSTVISSGILPTFPTHSRHCLTAASILGDPPIEWMDGRLMEKEKKWRRDNGHCLCCHYPGHIAETCTLGVKKKGKGMEFIKETQETGKVSCNISFPVPTAPPPCSVCPLPFWWYMQSSSSDPEHHHATFLGLRILILQFSRRLDQDNNHLIM